MAALLDRLLPPVASNAYHGPRVAVIGLALLTALMLFRSGVHLFAPDGGMQSIATMIVFEGDPDPDRVIHSLASLWGLEQLIVASLQALVLLRYRNLVPLMLLLLGVEWLGRLGIGLFLQPLGPEFFARTPPGVRGILPMLVVIAGLLALSLRPPRKPSTAPER
ncbi:MAG: hypothetical protein VCC02_02320 [Myxococcota bacterium]|jgi:hypothetical protein